MNNDQTSSNGFATFRLPESKKITVQLIWQKAVLAGSPHGSERSVQPDEYFPLVEALANPAVGTFAEQLLIRKATQSLSFL